MQSEYISTPFVARRGEPISGLVPAAAGEHLQYLSFAEPSRAREVLVERGDYRIRLADSHGQRSRVSMLVNRMYSWRGYKTLPSASDSRPNQITLEASSDEHLFGTLTLSMDSDEGLSADELYATELDAFRESSKRLCELTRLAVDPRYSSKQVLASLFHLAFIYARLIYHSSDAFIEVNPRHVGFYRRMLGFRQFGPERICARVEAPAVLMRLDLAHMERQIALHGGGYGTAGERSLYPYFFSEREQAGLYRRIWFCLENRRSYARDSVRPSEAPAF